MSQFHSLTVTDVKKTTRDAVILTLQPEDPKAFSFVPGQYLTFRREFDGEELRRSYSICAGINDGVLKVGIKRVDGGVFSTWANLELEIGSTLEAMPPMGQFYASSDEPSPSYLMFAGGSGITPILSIIKSGLQQNTRARYTLVYANRSASTVMFREEIEDLKNRFLNRFSIIHILKEHVDEIDLFGGRLDTAKCLQLFDSWISIDTVQMTFICGPEGMMIGIRDALIERGISKSQIRMELFSGSQPGRSKKPAQRLDLYESGIAGQVTLGGDTRSLTIPANTTLLEAAINNDLDPPYACKAGVCSTCKAKILNGEVEMLANHALEDHEVEDGYVLTCQSVPLSDSVVWDYDQSGH